MGRRFSGHHISAMSSLSAGLIAVLVRPFSHGVKLPGVNHAQWGNICPICPVNDKSVIFVLLWLPAVVVSPVDWS